MDDILSNVSLVSDDDHDDELPSYSDEGYIIVEIINIVPDSKFSKYEYNEIGYDGSAFWINEGVGMDYWLHEYVDIDECGWWMIEGIVGHYMRGDGWMTDDDVDWDYKNVRKATPNEIAIIGKE